MANEYFVLPQILESGVELISAHVRWVLRNAAVEQCGTEAIDHIRYNTNVPTGSLEDKPIWGEYNAATRSIAMNLEQHFLSTRSEVQDKRNFCYAFTTILKRELADTIIHESVHAEESYKHNNFECSELGEEQKCMDIAWLKSWEVAKHWDFETREFGPYLDGLIEQFIEELREDVKEDDAPEWKSHQLYMWDHDLAFYNPKTGEKLRTKGAFEKMSETRPWNKEPRPFTISIEKEENAEEVVVVPDPPKAAGFQPDYDYQGQDNEGQITEDKETETPSVTTGFKEPEEVEVPAPPTVPAPPAPVENAAKTLNVLQVQECLETIMRTLFHHVATKCAPNGDGTYNNAAAVLEPVNIQHIPHAMDLITHMDSHDALGNYKTMLPFDGFLKGIVSLTTGLPMYRFHLEIGGKMTTRSYMTQNPNSLDAEGNPKVWAQSARDGNLIMMLMKAGVGPTAHVMLEKGKIVGQEIFEIWPAKK